MTEEDFLIIRSRLLSGSIRQGSEADLQILMQTRLSGLPIVREFAIDKKSRFDFFWEEKGIVIEAKIRSGVAATVRQITRYTTYPTVKAVILFRHNQIQISSEINGKPIRQIDFWRNSL